MRFKRFLIFLMLLGHFCLSSSLTIAQQPKEAQDLVEKAKHLFDEGKYKEALVFYDKALEVSPHNETLWYAKGVILAKLSRFKEALACCEKAIKINPKFAAAWHFKGITLYNLDRPKEAMDSLDKAQAVNFFNEGLTLSKRGQYQEALVYYDRAIEIDPHDPDVFYNRGIALEKLGRYQEARESFNTAKGLGR
jgi:tetratricopeptide (TPR) repeat protein